VSLAEQHATLAYWTPQRRAAAVSADVVDVSAPAPRPGIARPDVSAGSPGEVPGSLPVAAGAANTGDPTLSAKPASYPYPYSSGNVPTADYTKWPYRINGKIWFTNNNGNYVCSGTSVASYHGSSLEDEVWTAGHCVANTSLKDPGVFDSFAEFVPAYNGTSTSDPEPFGIFTVSRYSVATNFLNNGDISVDEGAMEVGTNAAGQTLGQAVGWDGFRWNDSSNEAFTAFGYPAASPYTGNLMVEDSASTASSYTWPNGQGQPLIGIGDPMTGGSSGGAWDIDWSTTASGYIDGHNDYKFGSQPNAVYSPYQDSLSNTVRCFGASSC
jgi:V8-like Glu-specific endopeptidase